MPRSEFNPQHEQGVFRVFKDYTLVQGNTWLHPQMQTSQRTLYPRNGWETGVVVRVWNCLVGMENLIFGNGHLKSYLVSNDSMTFIDETVESYVPLLMILQINVAGRRN